MPDVTITRRFRAGIDHVFRYITESDKLLEWWGPEGLTVPVHRLDFSKTGAWMSEMHAPDGRVFKVSGQVTKVDPPKLVGFTWAWHDETDTRGHESHVMIELAADGDETLFTLTHSNLSDDESARSHTEGWTSSLRKLEARLQPAAPAATS
ncbi:MAG: SRPBCC domain-containing protein [Pseudomonadota bacterium]